MLYISFGRFDVLISLHILSRLNLSSVERLGIFNKEDFSEEKEVMVRCNIVNCFLATGLLSILFLVFVSSEFKVAPRKSIALFHLHYRFSFLRRAFCADRKKTVLNLFFFNCKASVRKGMMRT